MKSLSFWVVDVGVSRVVAPRRPAQSIAFDPKSPPKHRLPGARAVRDPLPDLLQRRRVGMPRWRTPLASPRSQGLLAVTHAAHGSSVGTVVGDEPVAVRHR